MSQKRKLLQQILSGTSDNNIKFKDLVNLLIYLDFEVRVSGSHHIFRLNGKQLKINLQRDGDMAKSYQIKQIRKIFINHNIGV